MYVKPLEQCWAIKLSRQDLGRQKRGEGILGLGVTVINKGAVPGLLMVRGGNKGPARCWGCCSQGAQPVLSSGFLPKAGFRSPGSALAYCAYTFPEALVCTSFHDCYVTLAVLNTVLSTAVSCYSRYLAACLRGGGWVGGPVCSPVDHCRAQQKRWAP